MRALALLALLCSACVVMGRAGYDEGGKPETRAALVLWSRVQSCSPEKTECACVGNGGLSPEAAELVKTPGVLGFFKSSAWSIVKFGAALLF